MSYNQPGPYGAPPQPYAQQYSPTPYGEPAPPYQQEPPRRGKGKAIGISVGALVLVGAAVGGYLYSTGAIGGSGGKKPYMLVMPDAVLGGKYTKLSTSAPDKQPESIADNEDAKALGIEGGTTVSQSYTNTDKQRLSVSGAYGKIANPRKTVEALIARMEESRKKLLGAAKTNVQNVTPWTDIAPGGFNGAVMKCKADKSSYSYGTISSSTESSVCVWGDSDTIGVVQHTVSKTVGGLATGAEVSASGNAMTAQELAAATATVRTETRKEQEEQ
ncbi:MULTISPECIES: hypothetical protein [Streptomyces]|uniref:Uncharacterized protein n=1 Tax=Streptomyces luteosporeus TaxID=173856 RepID=A0ABN3TMH7_9ACTN